MSTTAKKKITSSVRENLDVGDLVRVELGPVEGSETEKNRPCMVVSVQMMNARSLTVTVIPISHGTGPVMRLCPQMTSAQNDANTDGNIVIPQMTSLDLVARNAVLIGKITDPELILDVQRKTAAILGIGVATFGE